MENQRKLAKINCPGNRIELAKLEEVWQMEVAAGDDHLHRSVQVARENVYTRCSTTHAATTHPATTHTTSMSASRVTLLLEVSVLYGYLRLLSPSCNSETWTQQHSSAR